MVIFIIFDKLGRDYNINRNANSCMHILSVRVRKTRYVFGLNYSNFFCSEEGKSVNDTVSSTWYNLALVKKNEVGNRTIILHFRYQNLENYYKLLNFPWGKAGKKEQ